ncbi:Oxidoreductase FAD/NAD(P)-binding domain protein [Elusimicrobium minutum Pei191]|uniref:Oxidoreductase FAD/NAD(P)-binding domain protein n=1 Tax=Elusimicrobium minutum (strain Pei191) TaxID=445932 RepID=B2KBP5_ELUMP|nr:sulfide/dihydroorotate dehydrogenase-like FAD/NAD-binding protein [Elusimicrobium minutum]ACC97732.1 Oxidoreductase FAD/NAD(P)-binding domain protein [Elusimicrobium minutum Pei191]
MIINTVTDKKQLSQDIARFEIYAPKIAAKAKAGQFVIIKHDSDKEGERVPVTLVDWDADKGTIVVIVQAIGKSTAMYNNLKTGDRFTSVVGPLGMPVEIKNYGTAAVVGGGVGIAEVYPIAKALKEAGNKVISVLGCRTKALLILEEEMKNLSDMTIVSTDDGSCGAKGLVTDAIQKLVDESNKIDVGFIIGPIPMMKFTSILMSKLGIKPYASLNPILLDGTGMCGCCRVTVGGEVKFACVDGPMFEGDLVDFDELSRRTGEYKDKEKLSFDLYKEKHICKSGLH